MNQKYTVDDVEEFLEITQNEESRVDTEIMQKLLSVQNKIKIFKNIDPNELKVVVYDLKFLRYNYKDHILEQGSQSSDIYYLIDGECQVFKDKYQIGEIEPGSSFGESGAIFGKKRNATVICSSKTASLLSFKIDQENFDFSSAALAILYKNLAAEINAKLDKLNNKVASKMHDISTL
ncbi:cyclic nucleotide-binding domain-containing protein [Sulfurimonas sp.]|uniref:cyclic nucleotide-binding domain-containing protein n=1 Tax=Sulfurimonas sp. TaxID=2022749 RepID=UPI0035629025